MSLTIELDPAEEARLREAAQREGMDPAALAKKLVTERLPRLADASPTERVRALLREWQVQDDTPVVAGPEPRKGETTTRALFRRWEQEDAAMTDEERQAEDRLWEEVEQALTENENRAGMRLRRLG